MSDLINKIVPSRRGNARGNWPPRTGLRDRPTLLPTIFASLGSLDAIHDHLMLRGAQVVDDLTWIVGEERVSAEPISLSLYSALSLDPEPIEAGWRQYTLGRRYMGPLLHLSPRGEVYVEFIDGYGLGMDATMPLYTLEQLDAILAASLGRREVAA